MLVQSDGYSDDVIEEKKWRIGDRGRLLQIASLFMIEVIISADDRVPKGRKNLTNHDIT